MPGVEPLEGLEEPDTQPAAPSPPLEPFSGEEIAGLVGTVVGLAVAKSEDEATAFQKAFSGGIIPGFPLQIPPARVLDTLQVGQALALFGIGKNSLPGLGNLGSLPPVVRLLVGAGVMAVAAYGGVRATLDVRHSFEMDFGGPGRADAAGADDAR